MSTCIHICVYMYIRHRAPVARSGVLQGYGRRPPVAIESIESIDTVKGARPLRPADPRVKKTWPA